MSTNMEKPPENRLSEIANTSRQAIAAYAEFMKNPVWLDLVQAWKENLASLECKMRTCRDPYELMVIQGEKNATYASISQPVTRSEQWKKTLENAETEMRQEAEGGKAKLGGY
ncbi:MAG: hypothetical protein QME66_08295 [Candidatus Eisenbacteria bacterium]|nr:hypothetical protein [Candidatus Eisenbacteria bacterium]